MYKCNLTENNDLEGIAYRLGSGCVACWGYVQGNAICAYPCDDLENCISKVCNERGIIKLNRMARRMRDKIKKAERDKDE